MLRVDRGPAVLTVVSRLPRLRVLVVIGLALAALELAFAGSGAPAMLALAGAGALVVVLSGRTVRARFERGRVSVRPAVPFQRTARRPLGDFAAARVETFAEARRRRAERIARGYAARSGKELPAWLRAPDAPGANDPLRRIVLVGREGEPFPVTAWLAEDDLEPARLAVEGLLA
jgi:hypothetical protein